MPREETERPRSHRAQGMWVKKPSQKGIHHPNALIPDPRYLVQNRKVVLSHYVLGQLVMQQLVTGPVRKEALEGV